MIRYYCSGFNVNNAFGQGLGDMFKRELRDTKSILYIPGSLEKIEKSKTKYIIITPCSEEYPNFHIEEGLNFDGISIYPNNNTSEETYPDTLVVGDETYQRVI